MLKPVFFVLAAMLAGCGTTPVVDFGPEPGTPGDESFMHYQPELHGPGAPPRNQAKAEPAVQESSAAAPAAAPATAAQQPVLPAPPLAQGEAPSPVSETMFNDAITRAVAAGDIDRALRLLEEAERLGSRSARPTFIEAIGERGGQ